MRALELKFLISAYAATFIKHPLDVWFASKLHFSNLASSVPRG